MARSLLAALVAVGLFAGPGAASAAEFGLAARVNGAEITRERLERFFEERLEERGRHVAAIRSPDAFKSLKLEALDELVDRELLWQEARRRKHVATRAELDRAMARFRAQVPDAARRRLALERGGFTEETYAEFVRRELSIRRWIEREVVPGVRVQAAEVKAFYERNADRFTDPAQVRARHVLVKVAPGADAARRAEARERIETVLAAARGGADFAELAREFSEDSTASSGGDLGWFARGRMVPAFEAAAFALEPGGISDVVETPYGFHVVRVVGRRPESVRPLDEAREQIRAHLREERIREAVAARVAELRATARIDVLIPL